ncbi:MAG: ComEC/Rec2 family competence protein [Actinomycetota bacterium]
MTPPGGSAGPAAPAGPAADRGPSAAAEHVGTAASTAALSSTPLGAGSGSTATVMGEGAVVALTAAAWVGAVAAHPVPVPVGGWAGGASTLVALAVLALWLRRPWMLIVTVGLLASQLGYRSEQAFVPVEAGPFAGEVVVVDEADRLGRGWRLPVRLPDGRRVQAVAFGPDGARLSALGAGTTVAVEGRLSPMTISSWSRSTHLLGELSVSAVGDHRSATGARGLVERLRTVILDGAEPLPRHQQALYTGLVVGEDRLQSDAQRARFRAAGLSHLLAVSGQNVAFVLAVAAVPLSRLSRRSRLVALLAVLVAFAVATRGEPSVLRATTMAGLSTWATLTGRAAIGIIPLGLTVTGLLLVDPFLVWSVGFRLSVAASAAIVVLGPVLVARLPGPTALRPALAVTLAAQVGVAPLLIHHFDRVPLASVPANLAAGTAAGLVMVWGLTVGPVAGQLPAPLDGWCQLPASALLWWLDAVARWAVRLPLPTVTGTGLVALVAVALLITVAVGRCPPGWWRRSVLLGCGVGAVVWSLAAAPRPPDAATELLGGGRWYPGTDGRGVLVVEADADRRLLTSILEHRITTIGVVVAERGSGPAGSVAVSVTEVTTTGRLLAPPLHRLQGAHRVTDDAALGTGRHRLVVEVVGESLEVTEVTGAAEVTGAVEAPAAAEVPP